LYTLRRDEIVEMLQQMSVVVGEGTFYSWTISTDQQILNVYMVDDPLDSTVYPTPVDLDPVIPDTPLPAPPGLTLLEIEPNTADLADLDLTLIARGLGFRETTVIVVDNVIMDTTYVSPEELNTILQPSSYSTAGALPVQVQQDLLKVPPAGLPFTLTGTAMLGATMTSVPGETPPSGSVAQPETYVPPPPAEV
jgi:hypothetical protein